MKVGREPWEGCPTEESTLIDRAKRGDLDAYGPALSRVEGVDERVLVAATGSAVYAANATLGLVVQVNPVELVDVRPRASRPSLRGT